MRTPLLALAIWFSLVSTVCGQRVYFGVVGGTALTSDFPTTDITNPSDAFGNPANRFQYLTGPRSLIVGALVEGRLTESFSIEADVLRRPMKSIIVFTEFPASEGANVSTGHFTAVKAWEFPVMLKYTLPSSRFAGRLRPFLAAGPFFPDSGKRRCNAAISLRSIRRRWSSLLPGQNSHRTHIALYPMGA